MFTRPKLFHWFILWYGICDLSQLKFICQVSMLFTVDVKEQERNGKVNRKQKFDSFWYYDCMAATTITTVDFVTLGQLWRLNRQVGLMLICQALSCRLFSLRWEISRIPVQMKFWWCGPVQFHQVLGNRWIILKGKVETECSPQYLPHGN